MLLLAMDFGGDLERRPVLLSRRSVLSARFSLERVSSIMCQFSFSSFRSISSSDSESESNVNKSIELKDLFVIDLKT